jgi:hypothetical protein
MTEMIALFRKLSAFADTSLPASWLIHALGALLLCPLIGAFPVLVFFVLRESEQYVHARLSGGGEPWFDYVFDLVAPASVGLVWEIVVGWNFATWWYQTW